MGVAMFEPYIRYKKILSLFTGLFLLLMLKIFVLQIVQGRKLAEGAYLQRLQHYRIGQVRGDILDRNGIPFTNREKKVLAVIQPDYVDMDDIMLEQICRLLKADFKDVSVKLRIKREPVIIEVNDDIKNAIMRLNPEGISFVSTLERYDDNGLAPHVIGYLNADGDGESGIEKFYNDILKFDSESYIAAVTDANRNIVRGLGYRIITVSPVNKKLNVKLTLDYHIQKIVEDVLDEFGISGAVVVLDVSSGDVVAMASKKDFYQDNIREYLDSQNNELFNKAVASYNLGSVFKIVDVAAALENNIDLPERYYCRGYVEIGQRIFRCSSYNTGGHGLIGLEEAFAYSCNSYFIEAALKTGYVKTLSTATILGLGSETGLKFQGIPESSGNLPKPGFYSEGDIANLSIGQGEVLATPLQIANLAAIIANNGIQNNINIVDSITDDNGNKVREIRMDGGRRVISEKTAKVIKKLMESVLDYGTGKNIDLDEYGGAAGKTGTAETGQLIGGEKVVHAWFAGYFPRNNPKFAVAVFVENGKNGSRTAAPVFEEIAKKVMKKGL